MVVGLLQAIQVRRLIRVRAILVRARLVEQPPPQHGLGFRLAVASPAVLVVLGRAAGEAQGNFGPQAEALEDLEGRDE